MESASLSLIGVWRARSHSSPINPPRHGFSRQSQSAIKLHTDAKSATWTLAGFTSRSTGFVNTGRLSGSNPGRTYNEKKTEPLFSFLFFTECIGAGLWLELILAPSSGHCCYQSFRGTLHGPEQRACRGSTRVVTDGWPVTRPECQNSAHGRADPGPRRCSVNNNSKTIQEQRQRSYALPAILANHQRRPTKRKRQS